MRPNNPEPDPLESPPREERALFADDDAGELVRRERVARRHLDEEIEVYIDGERVRVPVYRATARTDFLGNYLRDSDGGIIPRWTTIYDAAAKHWQNKEELNKRIPVLCHREYLDPIGVCRLCSV